MGRYEVAVEMGEVPVIGTLEDMHVAAGVLADQAAAYSVTLPSPTRGVTKTAYQVGTLIAGLNHVRPGWVAGEMGLIPSNPERDIGFHGNSPGRYPQQ